MTPTRISNGLFLLVAIFLIAAGITGTRIHGILAVPLAVICVLGIGTTFWEHRRR